MKICWRKYKYHVLIFATFLLGYFSGRLYSPVPLLQVRSLRDTQEPCPNLSELFLASRYSVGFMSHLNRLYVFEEGLEDQYGMVASELEKNPNAVRSMCTHILQSTHDPQQILQVLFWLKKIKINISHEALLEAKSRMIAMVLVNPRDEEETHRNVALGSAAQEIDDYMSRNR